MLDYNYDKTDRNSIFEYSKKIVGHCLRDFKPEAKERSGKGRLGQLVEELFFGYDVNSNAEADFAKADMELKCTPLKLTNKDKLAIKERLVCGMINYKEDWNKSFEDSHFFNKCLVMLLLFYLDRKGISSLDLKFLFTVLWQLPEKDLLIMKQDYEIIISKIRNGQAHTLSEGDTMYLGACRKGQKGESLMEQHGSTVKAPRRAWSLKMQYMRIVLEEVKERNTDGTYSNITIGQKEKTNQLVLSQDLKTKTFDQVILGRFTPYMHMDYVELCGCLHRKCSALKQKYFAVANDIVCEKKIGNVNLSEEFLKAGITMKTIRIQKSGTIKESMSFENIDYQEVYDCDEWFDSRLYELYSSRFLFVVFKETEGEITLDNGSKESRYELDDVFFWTMPQSDLKVAEEYWQNIRECVINNKISPEYFWSIAKKRYFHVRPKATLAADLTPNPNGGMARKYCYWFNSEYVKNIIEHRNEHRI